jgi:hypothetical protein
MHACVHTYVSLGDIQDWIYSVLFLHVDTKCSHNTL